MIQKIEVEMKKVWYVDLIMDNKNYLCKDNQFILPQILRIGQAIAGWEAGF